MIRAAVDLLATSATDDWRLGGSRRINRGPLNESSSDYILLTDIASCYGVRGSRALGRRDCYSNWRRNSRQGGPGSFAGTLSRAGYLRISARRHVSEPILELLSRRLIRQGVEVWRFSDDSVWPPRAGLTSRLPTKSWHHEVRRLGSTLNESKTHALTGPTTETGLPPRCPMEQVSDL